jgi:peptide/nickel transport system permease protein
MTRLLLNRLLAACGITLGLVVIMFALQHISHIDPAHEILGFNASRSAVIAERHKLGLDRPIIDQFFTYLNHLVHGNFGVSYRTGEPVSHNLREFLPATIELIFYALLATVVLGGLFGIATAMNWRGSFIFRFVMMVGSATPTFLLAVVGLVIFYKDLGWLPAVGRTSDPHSPTGPTGFITLNSVLHGNPTALLNAWWHLLLPVFCISLIPSVAVGRVLRSSLTTNLVSDHIRTARSKGLSERRIVLKHALRNSLGPALSMLGLHIGLMFVGVAVVEETVAWPGIGSYAAQSISYSDFPAITGVTLVLGVGYVAINLVVDVLQLLADPRQETL